MAEIRIAPDGTLTFMHTDELLDLLSPLGATKVERASHVEPLNTPDGVVWTVADPSGRDTGHRFTTRAAALAWEHENFWQLIGKD